MARHMVPAGHVKNRYHSDMSNALAPRAAVVRKLTLTNNITFPRELRDAIPDHEPSAGRVLKLDAITAQAANTIEWGPRVQVKLQVCETGKLNGVFDVWLDLVVISRW
jgi:hypothetical protein